jgi:hypothetical protein
MFEVYVSQSSELHFTLCVCALCMHFWSLQIYFSNSLSYILHCGSALYVLHLCLKSSNYILHSTLRVCALCMHFLFVHFLSIFNSLSCILHCVYACVCVCTLCLFILF